MLATLLATVILAAQPGSYLIKTAEALEGARADIPGMQAMSEDVAKRICAGGKLYAGGNPALISEMSGRAGGLMLTAALGDTQPTAADAVMYFADAEHPFPQPLAGSGAAVVLFGAEAAGVHAVPPLTNARGLSPTLQMAIQGWLFTAELIAACTRQEKMPVLHETIGLYGGIPRMRQYQEAGVFFHTDLSVPRIAIGKISGEYIERLGAILRRCEKENRSNFDRAGQWAGVALRNGGMPRMYSMGHLFPDEVEKTAIGDSFVSAAWNAGFSYIPYPRDTYGKGDILIHVGYQQPPLPMLQDGKTAGAKTVYVSVHPDRDFPTGTSNIWIDPMWPYTDACVYLPGYDIPALPASGIVNAAIAWEIYRATNGG
jgi:hypothetical protein